MTPAYPLLTIGNGVAETAKWSCVLQKDVHWLTPIRGKEVFFYAGDQLLGYLSPEGWLTIKKGYACDGYSPSFRVFGKWVRLTPTPKKAGLFPAILHDFTRQFAPHSYCPWKDKDTDDWFFDALVTGGEGQCISGTYHGAVSGYLGDAWVFLFRKNDPTIKIEIK